MTQEEFSMTYRYLAADGFPLGRNCPSCGSPCYRPPIKSINASAKSARLAPCSALGVACVSLGLAGGLIKRALGLVGLGRSLEILVLRQPGRVSRLYCMPICFSHCFRFGFQILSFVS